MDKKELPVSEMMTVREVAAYLNLNEKLIYRLVREGRLPGTKVTGKWTFPLTLVRQWMETNAAQLLRGPVGGPAISGGDLFVAGSNDLVMEHLISLLMKRRAPESLVFFANTGSLGGLRALALGKAHLAGMHLYDPGTDSFNRPFLDRYLPGRRTMLFNVAHRRQGLIVRPGDAGRVAGVADVRNLRLVNREEGSGTRLLLDLHLKREGISPKEIEGYGNQVFTHLEVGMAVASRQADVGLGIEPAALLMGLSFVPLASERYDVAVPVEHIGYPGVEEFLSLLQSKELREEMSKVPGYDFRDMGRIVR